MRRLEASVLAASILINPVLCLLIQAWSRRRAKVLQIRFGVEVVLLERVHGLGLKRILFDLLSPLG